VLISPSASISKISSLLTLFCAIACTTSGATVADSSNQAQPVKRSNNSEFRIAPPSAVSEKSQRQPRDAIEQILASDQAPDAGGEVRLPAAALGLQPGDVTGDPIAQSRERARIQRTDAEIGATSGAGEFEKKLGDFDRVLEVTEDENKPLSPSFVMSTKRIRELFQLKRYEDALVEANELLLHYPRSALLWMMKGTLHMRLSQMDLSLSAYEKSFDIEPSQKLLSQIEQLRRLANEREVLRQRKSGASLQPVKPQEGSSP
jgi:tetratricopeptide (TPR) repeat protein